MPDRKSLVSTLRLVSSLTLLAWALVASIRTSGTDTVSSRPDSLRRDFAPASAQEAICMSAAVDADTGLEVNALTTDDEEQDLADARDGPRVSFLVFCPFRKVPDRQPIAPRPTPSFYPLRS